jgi:predicted nucleic acid-binding protein
VSFVLDTCAVSEITKPAPNPNVLAWFNGQDPAALYVSVLTVGEIEKGMAALRPGRKKAGYYLPKSCCGAKKLAL